jgi:hypothetical protein
MAIARIVADVLSENGNALFAGLLSAREPLFGFIVQESKMLSQF